MGALATTTWTGSSSANWNDPANWTAGVPGSGDTAVVDSGNPTLEAAKGGPAPDLIGVTVDIAGDPTLDWTGVTLDAHSLLDWQSGAPSLQIDVTDGLTVSAGATLLAESANGSFVTTGELAEQPGGDRRRRRPRHHRPRPGQRHAAEHRHDRGRRRRADG